MSNMRIPKISARGVLKISPVRDYRLILHFIHTRPVSLTLRHKHTVQFIWTTSLALHWETELKLSHIIWTDPENIATNKRVDFVVSFFYSIEWNRVTHILAEVYNYGNKNLSAKHRQLHNLHFKHVNPETITVRKKVICFSSNR